MWLRTVFSEMNSSPAISRLSRPRATSLQDPELAVGQARQLERRLRRRRGWRAGCIWVELDEQLGGHHRREQRLAVEDAADAGRDLLGRHVLEEVAVGAGAHRLEEVGLVVGARQHEDAGRGHALLDDPAGLDAPALGHADVHDDDVGNDLLGLVDRLDAVGGLADDLDALLDREDGLQAPAVERVVVDDEDTDDVGGRRVHAPILAHTTDSRPSDPARLDTAADAPRTRGRGRGAPSKGDAPTRRACRSRAQPVAATSASASVSRCSTP